MTVPEVAEPALSAKANSERNKLCIAQDGDDLQAKNGDDKTPTILGWDGPTDKSNPYNWSTSRKWLIASVALTGTLILPWTGTSITVAASEINEAFGVSDRSFPNSYWPVTSWSLGGTVFVILLLPMMEDFGVQLGYLVFYVFFVLMLIPQALAQNFATLIVPRFFTGGCVALLANTIASIIPDLFEDESARSVPVTVYVFFYIAGSTLGPPLFAGVMQNIGNWRWIIYIQLIIYGAALPMFAIFLRETRGNVILRRKAKKIRRDTGRHVYPAAEFKRPSLQRRILISATRPIYLLFTEPVLFASTMWSAFSFGLVYLFTQSVEQVFEGVYGWSAYSTGYVQFAVVIGEVIGFIACLYQHRLFFRSAQHNTECPGRPIPEARLYTSVFASFFGIAGGMFVYAWTSYPSIPWIAPAIGLAMVGFGVQVVITAVADYVTDAYAPSGYAGSAISAVAAVENITAGLLPLATQRMYTTLGFQWASSLIGFLALLLSFAPVLFIWKGRWFRERSPFMLAGEQQKTEAFSDEL